MKEIILQTIYDITAENIEAKKFPTYALRVEIGKRIYSQTEQALHELVQSQTLKTGNTLNDRYYELLTPNAATE